MKLRSRNFLLKNGLQDVVESERERQTQRWDGQLEMNLITGDSLEELLYSLATLHIQLHCPADTKSVNNFFTFQEAAHGKLNEHLKWDMTKKKKGGTYLPFALHLVVDLLFSFYVYLSLLPLLALLRNN